MGQSLMQKSLPGINRKRTVDLSTARKLPLPNYYLPKLEYISTY